MDTTEWGWETHDGLTIHARTWAPAGAPKAAVCLLHGVGEHVDRYREAALALTRAGYLLTGFDQRGFGRSDGPRGYVASAEDYFGDLDTFLEQVAGRHPGLPRFLYGHSMGAMLILAYTPLRSPTVAGVIAAAPGLRSPITARKGLVRLGRWLARLAPRLTLSHGIDPRTISREPAVANLYRDDPLAHSLVTPAWGRTMLELIDLALENAPRFPVPLLLMHGSEDPIASASGSRLFAGLAPRERVTLQIWDGFRHELHTDPQKAQVFQAMIDWLDRQLEER